MDRKEQLIEELKMDIEQLYRHEDDAAWYAEDARNAWLDDNEEEQMRLESLEQQEEEEAHQLRHAINCDLEELSALMGQKVTMEDFTNGDIFS